MAEDHQPKTLYQPDIISVKKQQKWKLQLVKWPLEFSRDELRDKFFWYRKSFVYLLCTVIFIGCFQNSPRKIASRQLLQAEIPDKLFNISHPEDTVYSLDEQRHFLSKLNSSLSLDEATFEFIKKLYEKNTRVTGSQCDGDDLLWSGQKLNSIVYRFPFYPDCDVIRPDTMTLIYIYSRVTSFKQREQIRTSWASEEFTALHNITIIFVISLPKSIDDQKNVEIEHRMHADILQVNVHETYDNLAFKTAGVLTWISKCARNVPTIAKVDDDSIPNIILLQEMYKHRLQEAKVVKNLIYCKKLTQISVKRAYNVMGKYKNIVTTDEFAEFYFPTYCQGRVIFMTTDVAIALFNVFLRNEIFRVDDAYMSGLLRSKTCVNITDHYTYNTSFIKPLQWRGLFIDFSPFSANLYMKLGLDITKKTSHIDMPEDLINDL